MTLLHADQAENINVKVLKYMVAHISLDVGDNCSIPYLGVTVKFIICPRCVARQRPGSLGFNIIWALTRETLTLLLVNNKGADQTAHLCSLISAFVIRYLRSEVS